MMPWIRVSSVLPALLLAAFAAAQPMPEVSPARTLKTQDPDRPKHKKPKRPNTSKYVRQSTHALYGHDTLEFLDWSDSCSVAIKYLLYPRPGEDLMKRPKKWSIGTVSIHAGERHARSQWHYRRKKDQLWDKDHDKRVLEHLKKLGYVNKGHVETLRDAPVAERPGLRHTIHSTSTLKLLPPRAWPPRSYALREIRYSPLGTCVFLTYRNPKKPEDSYRYRLLKLENPTVRRSRARAHVTNGLLLYQKSDIYAAQEELEIASTMDPSYALARYYHAILLSTHGRFGEALVELKAAVEIDPKYARKAREAIEFDSVWHDPRFKEIVKKRRKKDYSGRTFIPSEVDP